MRAAPARGSRYGAPGIATTMTSPTPGVDPHDTTNDTTNDTTDDATNDDTTDDATRTTPAHHPTSLDSRWLQRRRRRVRAGRGPDAVPDRSDVVVVGAGIAGLLAAWHLRQTGRSVTVIDAGAVAGRTTGHSTAKVTALHGTIYQRLAAARGADAASAYASAQQWAVGALRDLVGSLGVECGFTEAVAYTCATTPEGIAVVEDEVRAAAAAGLAVSVVRGTELDEVFDLDVTACGLGGQAHLDPVAFCDGLAVALRERGADVVEHVRVCDVDEDEHGCEITLQGGRVVRSDQVVLATHLPIVDPALLAGRSRPERSYVVSGPLATSTRREGVIRGMYLSIDEGWSIRPADGSARPDLVVGGFGHAMTDDVESSDHLEQLTAWATTRLGLEVHDRWSAFDYVTSDGVPFVGRLSPRAGRRFVATGFGKWGFTNAMVAARAITDEIEGAPADPLLDATRILPTLGTDLLRTNVKVARRFVVDRVRSEPVTELGPGDGAVVRDGLHHVARAVTLDGTCHELDATCPHLGCIVQFDRGEQTWNCPCHGSRFAIDGTVLDGPAVESLTRRDGRSSDVATDGVR